MYNLVISLDGQSWKLKRRYAAFSKFYRRIKGDCKDLSFPPKAVTKLTEAKIHKRLRKLQEFMDHLLGIARPLCVQQHLNEFLECSQDIKRSRTFWKCVRQGSSLAPPPRSDSTDDSQPLCEKVARIQKVKGNRDLFAVVAAFAIVCLAVLSMLPYTLSLTTVWFTMGVATAFGLQQSGINVLA